MLNKLKQIFRVRDLRSSILFVLGMLVIFRFLAHIPIPGVDSQALSDFFASNQLFSLVNLFSGGGMENFSIVAMGVAPYITSSIIFQLLSMVVPKLEEISREGEAGQRRINQWTRLATIPLAIIQAYGLIALLRQSGGAELFGAVGAFEMASMLVVLTAGTVFLMWVGELISEKKIGNGISLLIFAGIIAGVPGLIQQNLQIFSADQIFTIAAFLAIAVVTVIGVVIVTEGQRNIPISYARRLRGMAAYGGVDTHLPLRVNQGGVIPIIFAISLILLPSMVAQFFLGASSPALQNAARFVIDLFENQLFYGVAYFALVFFFTYFYTAVIFHPDRIAENLQKQGGFIPGIRPGEHTANYLQKVSNRILLGGALFLSAIAVLPIVVQEVTGTGTLVVGGTSLLIVVAVVIDVVKQIESQMTLREYEGL